MPLSPKVLEAESICLNCGEIMSLRVEFNHALIEPATCAKCGKPMTPEEVRHGFVRRDREKSTIAEARESLEAWNEKLFLITAPLLPVFFYLVLNERGKDIGYWSYFAILACLIYTFVKTQLMKEKLLRVPDRPEYGEIRRALGRWRNANVLSIAVLALELLIFWYF